jgi:hypothetical protein
VGLLAAEWTTETCQLSYSSLTRAVVPKPTDRVGFALAAGRARSGTRIGGERVLIAGCAGRQLASQASLASIAPRAGHLQRVGFPARGANCKAEERQAAQQSSAPGCVRQGVAIHCKAARAAGAAPHTWARHAALGVVVIVRKVAFAALGTALIGSVEVNGARGAISVARPGGKLASGAQLAAARAGQGHIRRWGWCSTAGLADLAFDFLAALGGVAGSALLAFAITHRGDISDDPTEAGKADCA